MVKFSWRSDRFIQRYNPNCGKMPNLAMFKNPFWKIWIRIWKRMTSKINQFFFVYRYICGKIFIKIRSAFLSTQCISSIGQIKSVCVSVSERDRNLPPIFTKLATKVESQEMCLPIVFGGNPKYFYPTNRKLNESSPLLLSKNMFNVENGDRQTRCWT